VIRGLKKVPGMKLIKTPSFGKRMDEKKDEYGWETMKNTKRLSIDTLNEQIRNGGFTDYDKDFWYECSTYVRDEKGRTNAQPKKYDDMVMATAITIQADLLIAATWKPESVHTVQIARDIDVKENWVKREKAERENIMEEVLCEF